jgi:saccharopine dehydrogenase (NAD+, L-lysine-forming)
MYSNKINKIFIRKEIYNNEFRCPIIPNDIPYLLSLNFIIYVESSSNRCYKDDEYEKKGAIIVNDNWFNYNDSLIIGIKELYNIELLNNHYHIYFSHSYKNQVNSKYILDTFKKSNSILFDLEYFINNNQRLITFGYYAGIVGCSLGLIQYFLKLENKKLKNLKYWASIDNLKQSIYSNMNYDIKLSICIIGSNGRCGTGVKYMLDLLNLSYTCLNRNDDKNNLEQYDIIYNCINLTEKINIWFNDKTIFNKNLIICDISCDYNNIYNPINIYNNKTTWDDPIYSYNEYVDIIAIDNLPSLLPFDSSISFSSKMIHLLETFYNDKYNYWNNNYKIFLNKIKI